MRVIGSEDVDATAMLHRRVRAVLDNDNCSGCGACTAISPALTMKLDADGYLRPQAVPGVAVDDVAARRFDQVCPGVSVRAPAPSVHHHPILGRYEQAWSGWAADEQVRWRGSSGGVLTALASWLLENGLVESVAGAAAATAEPLRTAPIRFTEASGALEASGSRYAPVSVLSLAQPVEPGTAIVGKPCEVYAARRLLATGTSSPGDREPLLLSFFCAGVPSQRATEQTLISLGADPAGVTRVDYRGQGCPGSFRATTEAGVQVQTSYEDSWGKHLGRQLQTRCKLCPDGTGMHADVAVGDYWSTDAAGYPVFDDHAGTSVVIARTARGVQLIEAAAAAGVVVLEPVDLDEVAQVQPLQVRRAAELPGRLIGRRLAGKSVPRYPGFGLLHTLATRPRQNWRAALGGYRRIRKVAQMAGGGDSS